MRLMFGWRRAAISARPPFLAALSLQIRQLVIEDQRLPGRRVERAADHDAALAIGVDGFGGRFRRASRVAISAALSEARNFSPAVASDKVARSKVQTASIRTLFIAVAPLCCARRELSQNSGLKQLPGPWLPPTRGV